MVKFVLTGATAAGLVMQGGWLYQLRNVTVPSPQFVVLMLTDSPFPFVLYPSGPLTSNRLLRIVGVTQFVTIIAGQRLVSVYVVTIRTRPLVIPELVSALMMSPAQMTAPGVSVMFVSVTDPVVTQLGTILSSMHGFQMLSA
jgi:hypothetical protein